jgi:HK97 family phage portal protein
MANWLTRVAGWLTRAPEGQYRPGPYFFTDGSWLPASAGRLMNWWQAGYTALPGGQSSAIVEACVSAYAQTVAMCPGDHWRARGDGGRDRVTNSALCRILQAPNDYQSISDFLLNLVRRLYENGEAFAVAIRNNRAEIIELHLMRRGLAMLGEDGSVFYSVYGNQVLQQRIDFTDPIPARDVLHVRLNTPTHPLKGVSPILAATLELALSGAALNQQIAYYLNQARPSYILETDLPIKEAEVDQLREKWEQRTTGENAGKTPILTHGLKAHTLTGTANDGLLADLLKMNDQAVAVALRVPLAILGIGGTPYASTELLMQQWIANGLGFTLNHLEEAFGQLFNLAGQPTEYLEFNTRALLRSAFKDRIEGLARAVISGIYAPDEARAEEDLSAVANGYGAMPRVQQQVVPLSYGANMQPPPPAPAGSPPSPAPNEPEPDPNDPNEPNEPNEPNAGQNALRAFRAAYGSSAYDDLAA